MQPLIALIEIAIVGLGIIGDRLTARLIAGGAKLEGFSKMKGQVVKIGLEDVWFKGD